MRPYPIVIVVTFLVGAAAAGCAPDAGLRITIDDGGSGLANRLEKVELHLVASQTDPRTQPDEGYLAYTCRPSDKIFVAQEVHFPLVVTVRRGERFFWECVALRVLGYTNADDPVAAIRAEALFCEDLENDVKEVTLVLSEACLGVRCAMGELCYPTTGVEAACGESSVHRMFEVAPAVDDACE